MPYVNWEGRVEFIGGVLPFESELECVGMGHEVFRNIKAKCENNVGIGVEALTALTTGNANCAVGSFTLKAVKTTNSNTAVGQSALEAIETTGNVGVGNGAGKALTGNGNVVVGLNAGQECSLGNTIVGNEAGKEVTGENNVIIGNNAGKAEKAISKKLIIANNETTAIIKGVMSATAASNELELGTVGGKIGHYGVTPTTQAAEIKVPGAFKAGLAGFETEAECKAIRDKQAAMIEAMKKIGICV